MNLLQALAQALRIPELRRKLLFTLGLLLAFRILASNLDPRRQPRGARTTSSPATRCSACSTSSAAAACSASRIVALGLNPYINATIIMQLMTVVSVRLKELSKEGEIGRKKITRYTRWLTVPLAMLQAYGYLALFTNPQVTKHGAILNNPSRCDGDQHHPHAHRRHDHRDVAR